MKEEVTDLRTQIKVRSNKLELPAVIDVQHLTPGESVGFNSVVSINYAQGVEGTVIAANGFAPLDTGDRVCFYSDGVPEATGADKSLFGEERMLRILDENARSDLDDCVNSLLQATLNWSAPAPLEDDVSILMLELHD